MHFPLISAIPKRISPNFPECKMLWEDNLLTFYSGRSLGVCVSRCLLTTLKILITAMTSGMVKEVAHGGCVFANGQCLIHLKISDLWILINEGTPNHPFKWHFTSCLPSILRYPRYLHLWKPPLIPSGYLTVRHGKIHPFLIGKPSITMGHFPWQC